MASKTTVEEKLGTPETKKSEKLSYAETKMGASVGSMEIMPPLDTKSVILPPEALSLASKKTLQQRLEEAAQLRGDQPNRGIWASSAEYVMNLICYCIGLGNIWRYPYVVYESGGGSFLLIYWTVMAVCGIPSFFLELCIGQYSGLNATVAFARMCPLFEGLGWSMFLVTFAISIYFNYLVGLTLRYIFAVFTANLPWIECGPDYESSINCTTIEQEKDCRTSEQHQYVYWNNTCTDQVTYCKSHKNPCADWSEPGVGCKSSMMTYLNRTHCKNNSYSAKDPEDLKFISFETAVSHTTPSEDYLIDQVLALKGHETWDEPGTLKWDLVLCLLAAWVLSFLITALGPKSMGKAAFVTGLTPYVLMAIFFVQAATLEGYMEGLDFYLVPIPSQIVELLSWQRGLSQIFFSLGVGEGSLITLASYNRFHGQVSKDAIAVCLTCGLTSFFMGFVTFGIAGFLSLEVNKAVGTILKSGHELAFTVYPTATGLMPVPQLWAFMFFLMLLNVGANSMMACVELLTSTLMDHWPVLLKWRTTTTAAVCAVCFICGLPFCLEGTGFLWFLEVDTYATSFLMIIIFCETIIVAYFYGIFRFERDYEQMMGEVYPSTKWYFRICICFIMPIGLLSVGIYSHVTLARPSRGWYVFPDYMVGVGWIIYFLIALPVIFFMIYNAIRVYCSGQSMWTLVQPTAEWGPPSDILEKEMVISMGNPHDQFLQKLEEIEKQSVRSMVLPESRTTKEATSEKMESSAMVKIIPMPRPMSGSRST